MASLARSGSYDCRDFAIRLCTSRGVQCTSDCILVVDRFLRDHFNYRREQDEVLRTVPFMLNDLETIGEMQGDCDDMTIMACSLFCALGVTTRMVAIRSVPGEFDHVFCEALDSDWIPVDPTVPYGTPYVHYGMSFQAV
jgi:hypothetical protein